MSIKYLAAGLAVAAAFAAAPARADGDIPVDRVILSTSGLANFVHKAEVRDNASVAFPVRLDQVDDILKSLVVFDRQGRLGGVTLPGRQPLDQVFRDLPFDQNTLASPAELLNAYQGAEVTVKGNSAAMTGRLVRVVPEETVTESDRTIIRHRLTLMTGDGLRQALLEDLQSVQFSDAKIRADIARALDAIRENGASERRVLTVSLPGSGARPVTLSYVVDAPLWKTAYRMVVPEKDGGKGLLQGWAIVENQTAGDWENVDLTLVSGNPVTFRQALYQSYYVERPEIPVQVFNRVMPRADGGTIAVADTLQKSARRTRGAARDEMAMESMAFADAAVMAAAPMAAMAQGGYGGMANVAQAASAAEGAEAATQVLFRFPDRFSLKSGQSLMLPFVSREMELERVALYQPDTHTRHPLAAISFKNAEATGLPPGVLTLYEESALLKGTSFVGDAVMPVVAAGETRMVSYALDTKTAIDRDEKSDVTEGRITIAQGVMRTAVRTRAETVYTVKAPEKEDRTVVIEHPRRHDYTVAQPDPKSVEVTETHYRLRLPVKAGETKTLSLVLEHEGHQSYAIANMPLDHLLAYAGGKGEMDAKTRKDFARLAEGKRALDAVDARLQTLERQRKAIFDDQARLRENLKSLTGTSDIQQKYLQKLNEQEDRVGAIEAERQKLEEQRREKVEQLQKLIAAMG